MAQSNGGDDFNRLYERLVLQCTSKKKTAHNSADVHQYIEPVQQTHEVTIKLEDSRRQEKQEHDTKVASMVRCLRLARNLRRFALGIQCKSFYLACQLVDASEEEYCQFVQYCQKMIRRRKRQCFSEVERRMKLEGIAARLFLRQAADFQKATTMIGRHRVVDELLFFSIPNSRLLSQIGYFDKNNVVPVAPRKTDC